MGSALHHVHKRKRIHHKKEKYPHPNKFKSFIDRLIYVVAIVGPIITIPQVLKIWLEQSAAGVSLVSWSFYLIGSLIWLSYGIMHKEKPIILSNCLWLIANIFIVLGILIYG